MRKASFVAGTAVLTILGLWACGMENSLVGGECSDGYALSGDRCVPVSSLPGDGAGDGGPRDGSLVDGAFADGTGDGADDGSGDGSSVGDDGGADADGGVVCAPPLVACGGVCISTESDPLNCGACNNVCPSLLCSNSTCQGTVAGHIVVFGHDYVGAFSNAQRKALENAVLLAPGNVIRVRSYEQYANATAVAAVKNIVTTAAQAQGRTAAYAVAVQSSDVAPMMTKSNTDVLVVYDQVNAPAATLGALGAGWAATLGTFTQSGGIVLVLDGRGGANPQMPTFLTNSLLLNVTSDTVVPVGTPLVDIASSDAIGQGLVSPYGAGQNTVHFACNEANGGNVTYVVVNPSGGGTPPPVIIHKVAP